MKHQITVLYMVLKMYKVVEKFISINGEGLKAGELACFIRFHSCNLSCNYCDTKWALLSDCPYTLMSSEEILDYIKNSNITNVTLTGGEPLIQPNISKLIDLLLEDSLKVEIETNGSIDFTNLNYKSENLSLTVDYKSISSGMNNHMLKENLKNLGKKDSIKFVVGTNEDLLDAKALITNYNLTNNTNIFLSPIYNKIRPDEIVAFMKDHCLNNLKLQLQLHKIIWSPEKRGV